MIFGWLLFIVLIGVSFYMYDKNSRGSSEGKHGSCCCNSHGGKSSCCHKDTSDQETNADENKHENEHNHD